MSSDNALASWMQSCGTPHNVFYIALSFIKHGTVGGGLVGDGFSRRLKNTRSTHGFIT